MPATRKIILPCLALTGLAAALATARLLPRPGSAPLPAGAWPAVAAPAPASLGVAPAPLPGAWFAAANGDRVRDLLREEGRLWSASSGGVLRWELAEGSFRQYLAPQDGLPSGDTRALARDRQGTLWVATAEGLARWDEPDERWQAVAGPPGSGPAVSALAAAPEGGLWVGFEQRWDPAAPAPDGSGGTGAFAGGGLAWLNTVTGRWGELARAEADPAGGWRGLPSDQVTALAVSGDGLVWAGTRPFYVWRTDGCQAPPCAGVWARASGGLAALDPATGRWARWGGSDTDTCTSDTITGLAPDPAGRVWVGTRGKGLQAFAAGQDTEPCVAGKGHAVFRRVSGGQPLPGTKIWSVAVGEDGQVYAGVGSERGQGVAALDFGGTLEEEADDRWTAIGLDGVVGAVDPLVSALELRGGSLFAGTITLDSRDEQEADGYGIKVRGPDGRWETLATAAAGPPGNRVTALAVHPVTGHLWLGTVGRGVARWDGQAWQGWRAFGRDRVGATLAVTGAQRAESLLLATDLAGYRAAFPAARAQARLGLDDPVLYELYNARPEPGGGLRVTVFPAPEASYPRGAPVYTVARGPAGDHVTGFAFGPDGRTWLAARASLARRPNPAFGEEDCDDDLTSPEPDCHWDGGLAAFDGAGWRVWEAEAGGLPSREAQAVAVDARGQVWVGTGGPFGDAGRGLAVLAPGTGAWTVHTRASAGEGFGYDNVSGLALDPVTGQLWLASQGRPACPTGTPRGRDCPAIAGAVTRWDGARWQSWSAAGPPPAAALPEQGAFNALAFDRAAAQVWVGGWEGEPNFHWNDGTGLNAALAGCPRQCTAEAWSGQRWPGEGGVYAIAPDASGRLWVGGHRSGRGKVPPIGGLRLLTDGVWSLHTSAETPLPSDNLTAFAAAGQAMWVGTLERGAILWRPAVLDERAFLPLARR